jgi:hypothetical protein
MRAILKDSAAKVVNGVLFGAGFGLIVGLIYYIISEKAMHSIWNDEAANKLIIKSHEEVQRNDTTLILGTFENTGTDSARMSIVQVDLFDKAGKFVDQCSEYLSGTLKSGELRNFKVSCGSKERPVAEHDSYKVRVVGSL